MKDFTAATLGLPEATLEQLRDDARDRFEIRAVALSADATWAARLKASAKPLSVRGRLAVRPLNFRIRDLATEFGRTLSGEVHDVTVEYARQLTRHIALRHSPSKKLISWQQVKNEAFALADELADWENSRWWLARMLQGAGYKLRVLNPLVVSAFRVQVGLHWSREIDYEWIRLDEGLAPNRGRYKWNVEEAIRREATLLDAIRGPQTTAEDHGSKSTDRAPFNHSEDYRSVSNHGDTFTLTVRQAQFIQILHEASKNGRRDVAIATMLERLETASSRWQDTFKSNPKARKALIEGGERRGTLRLKF